MNIYLIIIIAILVAQYLLGLTSDLLNFSNIQEDLPEEFKDVYDNEKYKKSQHYLKDTTKFGLVQSTLSILFLIPFIKFGGFNYIDTVARSISNNQIIQGLIFVGIIIIAVVLIGIPFSLYSTFHIEEKYGFNKTTPKTFVLDLAKTLLLTILIGAPIMALVFWFFIKFEGMAWLYCWIAITAFQIILTFLAPILIMPLFNKFISLKDCELKDEIEQYAAKEKFKMKGVFTMDGSKRSSKSNAYFTGIGKSRRIVLFDTLIENQTKEELTSVLAHEMGHYKKKHILKMIVTSIIESGIMFYILSLFLKNEGLFSAFGIAPEHMSVYAGIVFFGFLYSPINVILGIFGSISSRKHEYEADKFSADTYGHKDAMISALKKLSVDNLSNLTPHPFTVFLSYSHPPVLQRIKAIRKIMDS